MDWYILLESSYNILIGEKAGQAARTEEDAIFF